MSEEIIGRIIEPLAITGMVTTLTIHKNMNHSRDIHIQKLSTIIYRQKISTEVGLQGVQVFEHRPEERFGQLLIAGAGE